MIKVSKIAKLFAVIFAFVIGCLSFGSGALAQIWLKNQSDGTVQKVKMTFENQDDVNDLIIGITGVIGDINGLKSQNRNIGKVVNYNAWIVQFAALFVNNIVEYMLNNPLQTKAALCEIFAQNISAKKLKILGNYSFVMVDYDAIVEGLEEFIAEYLGEETVAKNGLPYNIVFCP